MIAIEKVKEIFTQLQSTNSKLEKQRIIRENKDNKKFTDTLVFLLSPYKLTGLSERKINKKVGTVRGTITSWENVVEYLSTHNTGTDHDIALIQDFIANQPEDMQDFYKGLITKSIKLGCDAKIVNDVIPNLIPTFSVQLGTPIEKCKLKGNEKIFISRKLNGSRCVYYKGKFYTRQGKEYIGLDHIKSDIERIVDYNIVLDGELIRKNIDDKSDSENFQIGVGIANSKANNKEELKLVVFDMMTTKEFERGYSDKTYYDRLCDILDLEYKCLTNCLDSLEVVEFIYNGYDHNEIWSCLDLAEQRDWEGIIINLDTPYECKRTKNLIKVKKFFEMDLRCISVNEATTGKYKGVLGSITCKYKNGTVDVGSGFSDGQREYYFNNPNEIVGKIVTVKYKEATTNKNGGESLQFPVFVVVRFDKNIADDEIQE